VICEPTGVIVPAKTQFFIIKMTLDSTKILATASETVLKSKLNRATNGDFKRRAYHTSLAEKGWRSESIQTEI
jgi:hypothetical protein